MKATLKMTSGPALALGVAGIGMSSGLGAQAVATAAVTALCAGWWVTEALPIPATSLIPFAVFPVLGVLSPTQLATAYGHPLILLLLGGFLLSTAMERSGAHRRLAIALVRGVGSGSGQRVVLAFMLTSALLSMWISNSATTLMLLPIALAVLQEPRNVGIAKPLLLGIAYAASIGGLGTPIGTPPNLVFLAVYREQVGIEMSFLDWMKVGVPASMSLLPLAWWILTRGMRPQRIEMELVQGRFTAHERRVLWVFLFTALAWVTRTEPHGGWSALVPWVRADDGTVALLAVVLLFALPNGSGERLLDWETARRIPWGLLLLFAGGIAIAKAFDASGLSNALGDRLSQLSTLPTFAMVLGLCLSVTLLTEVTSNTAVATLLMPILAAAAVAGQLDPKLLMIPATLSASCAFMLPVATVPNAVVFGTEHIQIGDMARAGLRLNLLGALLLAVLCMVVL